MSFVPQELNICAIDQNTTLLLELNILVTSQRCKAPVLADNDLLTARELVHRSSKCFNGGGTAGISGADREENLADVDTGDCAVWLAPGTSHTGLQSISTSAGQHLVDAHDVVWVGSDSEMETFLSGDLDKVPDLY